MRKLLLASTILLAGLSTPITAQDAAKDGAKADTKKEASCNQGACKSAWDGASRERMEQVTVHSEGYKAFLNKARTELSTVTETLKLVKAAGFVEWTAGTKIKAGTKYYHVNRDRAMMLIIGGNNKVSDGVRISAAHIDSPRLELKGRPVYGKSGFALFQTNYHGGIKTYQWTNIPLALMGRVDKTDGTTVDISIGLDPNDPIMMIPDVSPHISGSRNNRKAREVITYEELDPIVANGPHRTGKAEKWVEAHLKDRYDIDLADLVSAELALVPAMPPRDMGFDRRLMAIYGQDDRLSGYAGIKAALDLGTPDQTAIVYLADNEESGNNNVTGASSTYLTDMIGEMLYAEMGSKYRQPDLTRTLRKSKALSMDVNPAMNPMSPGAWEAGNAPKLGQGINIKLYGKGFNANSEFIAWVRGSLDANNIAWQTSTYKVARGGGGTLGNQISKYNIDTIDFGVPVLSIHTPYAVSDKMDVHALYEAIKAFHTYGGPMAQ